MADGIQVQEFEVGEPVLVCRWRLHNHALPLANRHIRALASRRICGRSLSKELLGWAKQHIEWTLTEGTSEHPSGVLLLMVDAEQRAAMTAGPYEPLQDATLETIVARAKLADQEAAQTGVAPETLWKITDHEFICGQSKDRTFSGMASLVSDLAEAYGVRVSYDKDMLAYVSDNNTTCKKPLNEEAATYVLVSDEHGICTGSYSVGAAERLASDIKKLYS